VNTRNLEKLFNPQCVAVIGASKRPGSVGGTVLQNFWSRISPAKFIR